MASKRGGMKMSLKKVLYKIGGIIASTAFVFSACTQKYSGGFFSGYLKKEPVSRVSISEIYKQRRETVWEDGKLDAKEIRYFAKDYLNIDEKLTKDKNFDEGEKKELQVILNSVKRTLDQYASKTNIKVAYVMKISTPSEDIYRGTDYELKAIETKSIDDVAKDFGVKRVELLAKLLSEYAPLSGSYDDLVENAYVFEITKSTKDKIRYHLKKGLEGKVYISSEKIKELTDGELSNGEINGFAVQLYESEGLSWTNYEPLTEVKPKSSVKTIEAKKSRWPQDVSDITDKIDNKTNFKSSLPRNNAKRSQWPQNVEE